MEELSAKKWTVTEKTIFRFFFVFVLLFVHSFSLPHEFLPDTGKYLSPFFENLARWSGTHIFHLDNRAAYELVSDTSGFYVNAFNLLLLSLLASVAWHFADRKRENYETLRYWFFVCIRYYLALILFVYGFNKIFKWQFYLPEPNTLFTTVGNTPRDLLYWSSMGVSRTYTIFCGVLEIIPACLLLFRRTYVFAAFMSLAVLLNVGMVNLGYDISVKLFSGFLLLLCCLLLAPQTKSLFRFFSGKTGQQQLYTPAYFTGKKRALYLLLKTLLVILIIIDPLWKYLRTGNFNDDVVKRPPLHGAYEVELFMRNKDTLAPLLTDTLRWKRIFVHRQGYFITQQMNDAMQDYHLYTDTLSHKMIIENDEGSVQTFFNYTKTSDSTLLLDGVFRKDTLHLGLKKIDLKKLPLLQEEFGWTIEH